MNGKYNVIRLQARGLGVEYIHMSKCASNSISHAISVADQKHGCKWRPVSFRFTFVRHPLARMVSSYVEKIQTGKTKFLVKDKCLRDLPRDMSIEQFVDFLLNFDRDHYGEMINPHWAPQSWMVNSAKNVDFCGRLENLTEDWQMLIDKGLGPLPHQHKTDYNKTVPHTWQEMLTPKVEARAREFYRDDFLMWPDWWD